MATKDHEFTVGKGQTIWAGKSHYPDLVRLVVPKDQAVCRQSCSLRLLQSLAYLSKLRAAKSGSCHWQLHEWARKIKTGV
ncbi:hypothetical protein FA158_10965 [Pseudomonas aeruginosa]|nr:hypothetical protein [Pseudomonas aeruginosa]